MSESGSAAAIDRLPWLDDEPRARPRRARSGRWLWAALALVPIAAASYWLGTESIRREPAAPTPATIPLPPPATTAPLPEPSLPQPVTVEPVAAPVPAPAPKLTRPAPPPVRKGRAVTRRPAPQPSETDAEAPKPTAKPAEKPKAKPLQYWPATTSSGAAGRMVRIGVFSSRAQAKRGWGKVMKIYPGMKRIPAAVVPVQSMRNNKIYYRLQMGTTSQAHSEVLCQRMRVIGQSCVVVGLIELK